MTNEGPLTPRLALRTRVVALTACGLLAVLLAPSTAHARQAHAQTAPSTPSPSPHAASPHAPSPHAPTAHGHAAQDQAATPHATPAGPARTMIVVAGNGTAGFADGKGAEARFNKPIRLAPFGTDAIVVSDIFNHAIRIVRKDGTVTTIAGSPDRKGYQDGDATKAAFNSPHGVGTTADGRIAVAEAGNNALRAITPDAKAPGGYVVSTIAGMPPEKGNRDGAASQALFNSPHAAIWNSGDTLLTPDIGNASIRRVKNGTVTTIAGAAKGTFVYPMDIAWATDGRLLVADAGADNVRVVSADGTVTTLQTQAPVKTPHGIATATDGTIYVADMGTHRVLAIDAAGAVTTVAGVAGQEGGDATHLRKPAAVLVHDGWLWIADLDNHRICAVPLAR